MKASTISGSRPSQRLHQPGLAPPLTLAATSEAVKSQVVKDRSKLFQTPVRWKLEDLGKLTASGIPVMGGVAGGKKLGISGDGRTYKEMVTKKNCNSGKLIAKNVERGAVRV